MKLGGHVHGGRPITRASDAPLEAQSAAAGSSHVADERYRLISVDAVRPPEGCAGNDWFSYRIMQGTNGITGYRRGGLHRVNAELETLVAALNARREFRTKSESKADRRSAAAARRVEAS